MKTSGYNTDDNKAMLSFDVNLFSSKSFIFLGLPIARGLSRDK